MILMSTASCAGFFVVEPVISYPSTERAITIVGTAEATQLLPSLPQLTRTSGS